jgi:hypothetical protein
MDENINMKILKEEILKCIKKLENNKACGEDLVINEYIKSTTNTFIEIYEQLFNIIFKTGIVPDNVLKNSNTLSIGMFGCSLVLPFFNSFQNSYELLDFRLFISLDNFLLWARIASFITFLNLNITEASSSVDKLKNNSLLDNLCNIFLISAKSTFGTSEYSKLKHKLSKAEHYIDFSSGQ